jgi:hypothetical protein
MAWDSPIETLVPESMSSNPGPASKPRLLYQDRAGDAKVIDTGDMLHLQGLSRRHQGMEFDLKPSSEERDVFHLRLPERWNETFTVSLGTPDVEPQPSGSWTWSWSIKVTVGRLDPDWERVPWSDVNVGIGRFNINGSYSNHSTLVAPWVYGWGVEVMPRNVLFIDSEDGYVSAGDNVTVMKVSVLSGSRVKYDGEDLMFLTSYIELGYAPLPEHFPGI